MREREIEAYLKKKVQAAGGEVRKVMWIGRRGAPDRLVLLPRQRKSVWVELKATSKNAEEHQQREHDFMRQCGADVWVIDSKDMVDFMLRNL